MAGRRDQAGKGALVLISHDRRFLKILPRHRWRTAARPIA
jgi:ATPase subunit of ABC transporter with duplicated ATPase domains